jgi:hypothetical protein
MNAKKSLWALSILILSCGLAGCGGPVSEKSARTAYEKSTKVIAEGKAKLVSFRKINARKSEMFGIKSYEVEYEAELEILENVHVIGDPGLITHEGWELEVTPIGVGLEDAKYKKGQVVKRRAWMEFTETEKGWLGPDRNVY